MKKKILIILNSILVVFILSMCYLYFHIRNIIYESPMPQGPNNVIPNTATNISPNIVDGDGGEFKIPYTEQKGITNILLIGTDARELSERARSDSIIIATIDDNNKNVKLTSFVRDTYVDVKGHGKQKINAAYAFGGPQLLLDTIERNFHVKLDKYVIINFWGFEELVDAIGGLDLEVKNYEIREINKFIGEFDRKKSPPITKSGLQHLDGQQSLSYARIRQVGNGVFERDARQRKVLSLMMEKLKDTSFIQYPRLMSKLLPCLKTNIEPAAILNYAYTISRFKPLQVSQLQMPVDELSSARIYKGSWVVLMDKEQNAKILNDFIFKNKVTSKQQMNISEFREILNSYAEEEVDEVPAVNQEEESNEYTSDYENED